MIKQDTTTRKTLWKGKEMKKVIDWIYKVFVESWIDGEEQ